MGGFVTSGLAKTENDVARSTNLRRLSLVTKKETSRPDAPIRIQISEDLFAAGLKRSSAGASEAGEPKSSENQFQRHETKSAIEGIRRPFAIAVAAGLVLGYLLGRSRK